MTILRKSRLITLVFSLTWFCMSLSFSFGAECICCNPHKIQGKCNQITHSEESCLEIKCIFKDCQCHCISCDNFPDQEMLPQKEYFKTYEKNKLLVLKIGKSCSYDFIIERNTDYYQNSPFPVKYPSLFLINSLFLL